ncbi:hypothetical protein [Actinomadura sp. CNU-125]|uniref:hypothetical protein n=1 Tax=Actinomadura sp. CNU-125 TaxID=1904961 RepID=UPI001651B2D9|nr:hypothetical protein [Actinomadura sp. CNU-125]
MSEPNEPGEDELVQRGVDVAAQAHEPTEPDEEVVLKDLYGPPDGDGIYRGEGA